MKLLLLVMLIIVGCNQTVPEPDLTAKKLYELYPGEIWKVDSIEIRSGSTGQLKSVANQEHIQGWIHKVRNLEMVPDPNQEDRVGYLYGVSLFENKELKLRFTNNEVSGIYYVHNEELVNAIKEFFESIK